MHEVTAQEIEKNKVGVLLFLLFLPALLMRKIVLVTMFKKQIWKREMIRFDFGARSLVCIA